MKSFWKFKFNEENGSHSEMEISGRDTEWLIAAHDISRWWFYVDYVSDRICNFMWDQARQLGESGEYMMGRVRVVCFHIWSSEGGSLRLCRLRTECLTPVNKIDFVLMHTGLWGPANLVASTVTELDDTLPCLMYVHWDSVWATHGCLLRLSRGRHALGRGRTRPDSLIVIMKGGHSWCLQGSRVSCG
jgi:hypothetical protein